MDEVVVSIHDSGMIGTDAPQKPRYENTEGFNARSSGWSSPDR